MLEQVTFHDSFNTIQYDASINTLRDGMFNIMIESFLTTFLKFNAELLNMNNPDYPFTFPLTTLIIESLFCKLRRILEKNLNTRDELVDATLKVQLFPSSHTSIYHLYSKFELKKQARTRLDEATPKREFCIARAQNVAKKIEEERQKICTQQTKENALILIKQWLCYYHIINDNNARVRTEELKALWWVAKIRKILWPC